MKELVDQIIEEAIEEGYESTRCKPGRKRMPDKTLLNPIVVDHWPEWAEKQQKCRSCGMHCLTFCPGCARDDDCGPASGFYCHSKARDCMGDHHRKRARTCV